MEGERKIRNLVETTGEDVCVNDIINAAVKVSHVARDLEYGSKKVDLAKSKKLTRELRDTVEVWYQRLRGEVTDDVNTIAVTKNVNHKGKAGAKALADHREKNSNQ